MCACHPGADERANNCAYCSPDGGADARANCRTDNCADCCTHDVADARADCNAHRRADDCTDATADASTDLGSDSCPQCQPNAEAHAKLRGKRQLLPRGDELVRTLHGQLRHWRVPLRL